jgi:hypothetical protein
MGDQSLAEIARRPDKEQATTTAYRVLYDGQCEICQSCVSWLKALDHEKNLALAVVAELSALRVTGFPQFPLFFKQSLALRCPQFPTRFKLSIALREWLVVVYVPRTALIRAIAFPSPRTQGVRRAAVGGRQLRNV